MNRLQYKKITFEKIVKAGCFLLLDHPLWHHPFMKAVRLLAFQEDPPHVYPHPRSGVQTLDPQTLLLMRSGNECGEWEVQQWDFEMVDIHDISGNLSVLHNTYMVVFNLLSLTPFNFDFNCDELHSRKIETLKKNCFSL